MLSAICFASLFFVFWAISYRRLQLFSMHTVYVLASLYCFYLGDLSLSCALLLSEYWLRCCCFFYVEIRNKSEIVRSVKGWKRLTFGTKDHASKSPSPSSYYKTNGKIIILVVVVVGVGVGGGGPIFASYVICSELYVDSVNINTNALHTFRHNIVVGQSVQYSAVMFIDADIRNRSS